jgi:hypothetical protein
MLVLVLFIACSFACPPRPSIPEQIVPISNGDIKGVEELLRKTLAPCEEGPFYPSATSISASIVLGDHVEFINLGMIISKNLHLPD